MKETPILFSTPMVQAILNGKKTQTRRVIKPQPKQAPFRSDDVTDSPFGTYGDRLWVRETWTEYHTVNYIKRADGRSFSEVSDGCIAYKADGYESINDLKEHIQLMSECDLEAVETNRWRPSIHMPKKYARIWLNVIRVRAERLQDISEVDARAEGVEPLSSNGLDFDSYHNSFIHLWDSINKKRGFGWDKNPWVWVVEFRRIKR